MISGTDCSEIEFEYTDQFPEILSATGCSLLVSTYQAGQVIVIGTNKGGITVSYLTTPRPMGIAVSERQIAIGTQQHVEYWLPVSPNQTVGSRVDLSGFDALFFPATSHSTGRIQVHELAWAGEQLWLSNTRFSALCTLQDDVSFVPQWRPPFVPDLDDRDRCHLNGLAMNEEGPKFVTALAATSSPAGWREKKQTGGVVVDVSSGQVVCRGLCMPHSPRLYRGHNWVLNSGTGELGIFDPDNGQFQSCIFMPGFLRGLSFANRYAFVGLSQARETNTFGGLPITAKPDQLRCGIGVFDLETGKTVAVFKFNKGVREIFSVEVMSFCRNPFFSGSFINGSQHGEFWVLPANRQ